MVAHMLQTAWIVLHMLLLLFHMLTFSSIAASLHCSSKCIVDFHMMDMAGTLQELCHPLADAVPKLARKMNEMLQSSKGDADMMTSSHYT